MDLTYRSYNRYLAVAARVVRRSLKENQRLHAERRGEMDLKFAKWEVSLPRIGLERSVDSYVGFRDDRTASKERASPLHRRTSKP